MHDPMTVAFDIKSPFRGRPSKFWPKGYRNTVITIWHVDPLDFEGKVCRRDDDSCGWSRPPIFKDAWEKARQMGREHYRDLFGLRWATQEGKDYARVCNEPTTYEAIYWAWRALKNMGKKGWRYGKPLSLGELQRIQAIASNPVDNLKTFVAEVDSPEKCGAFFCNIYGALLAYQRPWYRHPRWHFWHWRLQIHPWQQFRRWWLSRCAGCGKRFSYGYSPVSFQWDSEPPKFLKGESGVYHSECAERAHTLMKKPAQGNA